MEELKIALKLNLTDKELARISGVSQQAINRYRTGKADVGNMRYKNAVKLIEYIKNNPDAN